MPLNSDFILHLPRFTPAEDFGWSVYTTRQMCLVELTVGIEPTTYRLQGDCSASWATSAELNFFNFSAFTTRKNKNCFYPRIFSIFYYNFLNKRPRMTTEKFVKKILHIIFSFWWAGKDSNLRHPAPKAIWKLLFNYFSKVDYFTVLFQLSYPPIFNWWGEMGSNHPSVIRTGFTDRTASTYGISPHNGGF